MERYCGFLKNALRSRSQPWRNLDERIKQFSYAAQLRMKYDLSEELSIDQHSSERITKREHVYAECALSFHYIYLKVAKLVYARSSQCAPCTTPNALLT